MSMLSIAATMAARRASEPREDGVEKVEEEADAVSEVVAVQLVVGEIGVDGVVLVPRRDGVNGGTTVVAFTVVLGFTCLLGVVGDPACGPIVLLDTAYSHAAMATGILEKPS